MRQQRRQNVENHSCGRRFALGMHGLRTPDHDETGTGGKDDPESYELSENRTKKLGKIGEISIFPLHGQWIYVILQVRDVKFLAHLSGVGQRPKGGN